VLMLRLLPSCGYPPIDCCSRCSRTAYAAAWCLERRRTKSRRPWSCRLRGSCWPAGSAADIQLRRPRDLGPASPTAGCWGRDMQTEPATSGGPNLAVDFGNVARHPPGFSSQGPGVKLPNRVNGL
jgi:hypothetical protein